MFQNHEKLGTETSTPARDIGIFPNPAFQSPEERARDAPRLEMLRKLQDVVDARGLTDFHEILKAKEEVEKSLKRGSSSDVENVEPVSEEKEEEVKRKKKKEKMAAAKEPKTEKKKKEMFPRLVRRNARRGGSTEEGQTWTEEVVMF
ncbi:Protein CBG23614 [Caenorhabditis briggsae]|uniref:Uncharacterized protein n=2 Tax=Caenorhabditis briggsae TaxID=6238 RepID=A0AAE9JJB1_CAEBR|nr:Protein CBG23614 [Caenorhabditis briggsae]ULT86745.1 hypothetical protein L3Y34_006450 [Caenorhabditis briggsae]UMM32494.1 hypothetical protein L5515_006261 [Caenorhabditis briggsae]CAP20427.2 Protein CBG23614 [Caenorhabditis briggsae]